MKHKSIKNIYKKLILILPMVLFFSGCNMISNITDKYSKKTAKKEFKKMCNKTELLICGSKEKTIYEGDYFGLKNDGSIPYVEENNLTEVYSIFLYTIDYMLGDHFKYKKDTTESNSYNYMFPDEYGIKRGDCEDYVITLIEDNIENGNIQKGEVKWIFGKYNKIYHSWAIITKEGKEFLFDTYNQMGITKERAYTENHYKKLLVLFSY